MNLEVSHFQSLLDFTLCEFAFGDFSLCESVCIWRIIWRSQSLHFTS